MKKIEHIFKWEYLIFIIFLCICYFNVVLHPQFLYDYFTNVFNPEILGNGFNLKSILNAFKFHSCGFRPIAYLSFYLNHYAFSGSITSFVIVNLIIHLINTILVYKISEKITGNRNLSLIAAIFWEVSPVNFFAVGYIVQRMTSLMALFGFTATVYFLKWEEKRDSKYILLSLLFVTFASLTKENGILFLCFFIVYHYINYGTKKDIIELYITGFFGILLLYLFSKNFLFKGFIARGTDPVSNFLTESRVLIFYIKNIIFPTGNDIYLLIDFAPSKGMFQPISTFISFVFLSILIVLSVLFINKDKVITISILGFFTFHLIESSFLPLHRVFLHRNYVASFFIILGFSRFLFKFKKPLANIILSILIINAAWVNIAHNLKWQFQPYYIVKNAEKYPYSVDARLKLANQLESEGKFKEAISINLNLLKTHKKDIAFANTLKLLNKMGFYKEAYTLAKTYKDENASIYFLKAVSCANLGFTGKAKEYFKKSLGKNFYPSNLYVYIGWLYENKFYDEVVFETERYINDLSKYIRQNQSIWKINNLRVILSQILLLKIECEVRIGLLEMVKKDIGFLKRYNCFDNNIENYINALIAYKERDYKKALKLFNSIDLKKMNKLEISLSYKKIIFTFCIYDKLGKEYEFKKLIERFSKNTIIYDRILKDMDKCY